MLFSGPERWNDIPDDARLLKEEMWWPPNHVIHIPVSFPPAPDQTQLYKSISEPPEIAPF